jgi:CBS domain containing-hemolysin-like protein
VSGLSWEWVLALGVAVLALHLPARALARALRTYSRSRLEELSAARRHPHRADDVVHHDEATELAAAGLAEATGVLLAVVLGVAAARAAAGPAGRVAVIGLAVLCVLGSLLAGAIGRVYAEGLIDRLWPVAWLLRALTAPLGLVRRLGAAVVSLPARSGAWAPRPSSVEVEIPSEAGHPEEVEADLPESVRVLIQRAVELTRCDVSELMTPRSAIVTLPASVTAHAAARVFRETGKSRIPVFGESRDDILGILYAKDLFPRMTDPAGIDAISPRSLVRPPHRVPETKNAYELLEELRSQRTQIAIVQDEYGGVSGLITLEDLLEQLVGAIDDEHDVPSPADCLIPVGDALYEVDATVEIEELNGRLALRLPTDADYLTVGGLAFHALGRVPEPGASFRFAGIDFTVVEVVEHAIRRVRIDLQARAAVGSP